MGDSGYDVVLLPSFVQVEAWRKQHALASEGGLFGQKVTTFNAWIAELWELYGDGRTLVDSTRRAILMRIAFSQIATKVEAHDGLETWEPVGSSEPGAGFEGAGEQGWLTLSPGLAQMAARCELLAAGVSVFDVAVQMAEQGLPFEGLSTREALFLRGIARYRRLLRQLGLVELGEVCSRIVQDCDEVFPRSIRVLADNAAPPSWRMEAFFAGIPQIKLDVRLASGAEGVAQLPGGVKPRFAFPAGRYASAALVRELVRGLAPGERAVVTSEDPMALYKQLEQPLVREGFRVSVEGQVGFGQTDFGRAYLAALWARMGERWDTGLLVDILHTPFSGFTPRQARDYDARLRADRLASRELCLTELASASEDFATLLELAQGDGFEAALLHFELMVPELPGRSPAWRADQFAALAALRLVREVVDALGGDWRDCATVLEQIVVTSSYTVEVQSEEAAGEQDSLPPAVLITTQGVAAQMGEGSCELLIACNLSAESYPLAESDDVAATLFEKLGLLPVDSVLARTRRTFAALETAPTREFVCMRPVNDADGNPSYASAMFEEFVDAYRGDAEAAQADGFGPADLPDELASGLLERGEQILYENYQAVNEGERQACRAEVAVEAPGMLGKAVGNRLVVPRWIPGSDGRVERCLSPSQVELYLECPYKWFVSRRLNPQRLEEGFGPLERGTFAHAVLERFYQRFQETGQAKVNATNLEQAQELLRQVAGEVRGQMELEEPGSGRLVAANKLEEREIAQFVEQLVDFLSYEAQVLPGFRPAYFEYSFEDQAVPYGAGCMIGTVDRIDVDEAGRAVIIDYKGSLSSAFDIAGTTSEQPGKVQTRIYAQMVKRTLGLDVVGALYLSYGKRHALAGALDGAQVEAAHVPGARKDALWCRGVESAGTAEAQGSGKDDPEGVEGTVRFDRLSFGEMLDATETVVAAAIERMEAGEIAPNPTAPSVCEYCPVTDCPNRGV